MHVPEYLRAQLRAMMDDPDRVGKQVAQHIGCSRATLYLALNGNAGPKTMRKLFREFGLSPFESKLDTLRQRQA